MGGLGGGRGGGGEGEGQHAMSQTRETNQYLFALNDGDFQLLDSLHLLFHVLLLLQFLKVFQIPHPLLLSAQRWRGQPEAREGCGNGASTLIVTK